uniref:Uncharacterized protein n=1 Tax=Tanacetum cinerariifolium TaxID=118510 RepID=A0A6L2MVP8_TANCI|nr:hypothetical protein [Tanacetum cinerariifolium]
MDVLSMLEESDDEGVTVTYEPVLPPVNLNVEGGFAPPPPAPHGIVTPVDNEMEDVEDEVLLSECLTRKMSGQENEAGGSGTSKADEKSNFEEAEKTTNVDGDVALGSISSKRKKSLFKKTIVGVFGASNVHVEGGMTLSFSFVLVIYHPFVNVLSFVSACDVDLIMYRVEPGKWINTRQRIGFSRW